MTASITSYICVQKQKAFKTQRAVKKDIIKDQRKTRCELDQLRYNSFLLFDFFWLGFCLSFVLINYCLQQSWAWRCTLWNSVQPRQSKNDIPTLIISKNQFTLTQRNNIPDSSLLLSSASFRVGFRYIMYMNQDKIAKKVYNGFLIRDLSGKMRYEEVSTIPQTEHIPSKLRSDRNSVTLQYSTALHC